jgi:DNA-binding response OmpR family regulator
LLTRSLALLDNHGVTSLDLLQKEWSKQRRQLERESRLLVVEEDLSNRRRFEDFLYRHRLSFSIVSTPEEALSHLNTGNYSVALVSETLSGLGGVYFIRKIRADYPHVDAMISSSEPTVDLVGKAFELRLLDIVLKPLTQFEVFGHWVRDAMRRSINRRMRNLVLKALHEHLQQLSPENRQRTTAFLEVQLAAVKIKLGKFNRVLVIEQESSSLRLLAEDLLLAGLHVESVDSITEGLSHVALGDIHLVVMLAESLGAQDGALYLLLETLKHNNPLTELMLVSSDTEIRLPLSSLRQGIAFFLFWPPASPEAMVLRLKDILHHCLHERLMNNLLAELYLETNRALGHPQPEVSFASFQRLIGLDHVQGATDLKPIAQPPLPQEMTYLDDVLDHLLTKVDLPHVTQEVLEAEAALEALGNPAERRTTPRVMESQFVRFRPVNAQAQILALVGDLSEGGLFIRTPDLLLPGTLVEIDLNTEYQEHGYLIRCRGQVAWVARDDKQFSLGPGFGIKFLDPPTDVEELLKKIVATLLHQ